MLPIGVFLVIFLGSGILTGDFYAMPAIVAFLIALAVAFLQNRDLDFGQKITIISRGVGDENIITMCLIFLCAGAFSGAVTAAGGVDSTVNLGLSILPAKVAVAYCGGDQREDGIRSGYLHGRGSLRRHVRRQPVHDLGYYHRGGEDPGM